MFTVDEICELMEKRGYTRVATSIDYSTNEVISILFNNIVTENSKERFPVPCYSVEVFLNGCFKMTYMLNSSIIKLCTPECGSVELDDHFNRIAIKFEQACAILSKYIV